MSKSSLATQLQGIIRAVGPNVFALSVHVKPNAKKAGIEWEEEQLNIKLNSPPVDNKANKEVCEVIAKMVDVPKGQVIASVPFFLRCPCSVVQNQRKRKFRCVEPPWSPF